MTKTVIGKFQIVDSAGIDGKQMSLPGEVSVFFLETEKSAEVIVPEETSWKHSRGLTNQGRTEH